MKTTTRPPDIEPYSVKQWKKPKVPVNQYDFDGHYIETYESMWEASKETGATASSISACCKGKYKSAGGFMWRKAQT
ncbi:MAG: hypothetical protein JXB49_05920 [Bacteroidales bacterium]|nr:hypothetical protein [Bacteroidales bacterium]